MSRMSWRSGFERRRFPSARMRSRKTSGSSPFGSPCGSAAASGDWSWRRDGPRRGHLGRTRGRLEAPGGRRPGLLRLGCGRGRGVLLPIFRTGDRDKFFPEVFHALGDVFGLGPDPGGPAPETAQTLAHAPEPRAAGVAAVPAPFAELAAGLSGRVPDFHCAAGDASGRVARLFNAPGDGAGVLVKPLPGGADAAANQAEPRPDALDDALDPRLAEEAADRAEPGRVGRPTLDDVFPASGGSAPEAGAIWVSRSMFRGGGRAEPVGVWSSSCRWRPAGRASARRA